MINRDRLVLAGGAALLLVIFGVPAILIPFTMSNLPERSKVKALSAFEDARSVVRMNFKFHADPRRASGRLAPLPVNSEQWIVLINPTGRRAPGGGPRILPHADPETGAIGLTGDDRSVTITLPAYSGLDESSEVIRFDEFLAGPATP